MRSRKSAFAERPPKFGRRLKTASEQLAELDRAGQSLADLVALIQQGRGHLTRHLATELRALLCRGSGDVNPLLLRLAARYDLPVPMYAVPKHHGPPAIVRQAQKHLIGTAASIVRKLSAHQLMDVEQWLGQPCFRAEYEAAPGRSEWRSHSVKEVIQSTAAPLGPAHYDPDLPLELEQLYTLRSYEADALTDLLIRSALVTLPLCAYVLRRGRNEGEGS